MTESSYTAWDDKQYVWPPPEGWYEASDGKWWPEGYGPPVEAAADAPDQTETAAGMAAESDAAQSDVEADQPADGGGSATGFAAGAADAAEEAVGDLAADGAAMADGSGAFSDVPMEMNDLSAPTGIDSSRFSGSVPDINDVLPTEEISLSSLPSTDGTPGLDDLTSAMPAVESAPDVDGAPGLGELPAPTIDGLADTGRLLGEVDLPDLNVPDLDPSNVGVGDTGLPDVALPDVDAPDFQVPDVELPDAMGNGEVADPPSFDELPAAAPDLGENVTQVLPSELPAAPTDFVPPSGPADGFIAPPAAQPLSPLDRPAGFPADPIQQQYNDPQSGYDQAQQPPQFAAPQQAPPPGGYAPAPGQFEASGQYAAPSGPPPTYPGGAVQTPGLDSQAILGAKPKGGRSKGPLLAMLGVLVLAAICAALYFAFAGGDDSAADSDLEATGPGSVNQPHPRATGVVVFYPDGDTNQRWVVEVLEPVRDATAEVALDTSVAPPDAGEVFATTRIRVRNESGVDGASLNDLQFNAVNAAGQVILRSDNQCSFTLEDIDYLASVGIGSQVEGNVCWSVPAGDLSGLKLGIESDKVAGRVHIALQ